MITPEKGVLLHIRRWLLDLLVGRDERTFQKLKKHKHKHRRQGDFVPTGKRIADQSWVQMGFVQELHGICEERLVQGTLKFREQRFVSKKRIYTYPPQLLSQLVLKSEGRILGLENLSWREDGICFCRPGYDGLGDSFAERKQTQKLKQLV